MRKPVAVMVIALFVALVAVPVAAQDEDPVNPLEVLIDAFEAPDGMEYVGRLVTAPITGLTANPDPVGDFEHSTGEEPGFTPEHIDITHALSTNLDAGPIDDRLFGPTDQNGFWAPTGPFHVEPPNYEPFHTFTGEEIHDGSQYGDGAVLFGFTLVGTPPLPTPGRCEYVVWINDLSRGPTFINHPAFPGDPAAGTNLAFGLSLNPEGQGLSSTFTLEYQEGSGFTSNFESDVRSFIAPNYVGITVPSNQIGEMAAVNFYSFCMEEGTTNFDPAASGADQTGLNNLTSGDLGLVVIEEQVIVIPTTTTTEATTKTTPVEDTGDIEDETDTAAEGDHAFPWWLVVVAGLGLTIGGWFWFKRDGDPCRPLLDAWLAADKKCNQMQLTADDAADACEEAELDLEDLEQERKDLCKAWPPACWNTEEGSWMEDRQGNRITSRGVHMRKVALGGLWDDYKAGKMSAKELEAKWKRMDTREFRDQMKEMDGDYKNLLVEIESDIQQAEKRFDGLCEKAVQAQGKADDACTVAVTARLAYDECVANQAEVVAASAASRATPTNGDNGETPGPSATGVRSDAGIETAQDLCDGTDPKRKYKSTGKPELISIDVDFSVITGISSGSERNIAGGEQLIFTLNDLARDLDFAGDMLSARSAGLHVGGAINGYSPGKYVATATGVIKGGIEATMATSDVLPEVPASAASAVTELLEGTAVLGRFVAQKVVEWMGKNQLMTVRLTMSYQDIKATPFDILECREGKGWVCVEKVWEIEIGQLKKRQGRERSYTVGYGRQKRQFERAVRDLSNRGAGNVGSASRRLVVWRSLHEPGPCDE